MMLAIRGRMRYDAHALHTQIIFREPNILSTERKSDYKELLLLGLLTRSTHGFVVNGAQNTLFYHHWSDHYVPTSEATPRTPLDHNANPTY